MFLVCRRAIETKKALLRLHSQSTLCADPELCVQTGLYVQSRKGDK